MRILIVGYHNPHFVNTIVYREKALSDLGHEVIPFDESRFLIPGRIRDKFPQLQRWDLERLNFNFISSVEQNRPDICIVVGGHTLLSNSVSKVRAMGIPIALWTTDVPVHFDNILKAAPFYTHLFCAGSEAADIFHQHGLKNVTWLAFACEPQFHKRVFLNINEQNMYSKDIAFVGSYYPNRAKILETIADLDLGVWGPYWKKLSSASPLRSKCIDTKMNYDKWVKIYNACKINIVIHYQDGKVPCHQASPKLFEAMSCGSFVLSDRQKDAEALFKDKEHLVFYNDEQDLYPKIRYYLEHPDERAKIADAGFIKATTHHTYQHRMKKILEVLANKGNS